MSKSTSEYNPNLKVLCECGGTYSMTNKSRHAGTAKHQAHVAGLADILKSVDDEWEHYKTPELESELEVFVKAFEIRAQQFYASLAH